MDPESPDLDFLDYYEWVEAQPGPKIAVMMDVDERAGRAAALGSMQARTLKRLGVSGIVASVAVQKPEPVRAAGMPVWSTGIAAAHGPYHMVRYGAPVDVGRVVWTTGDLIFADAAGAIRIPSDLARDVLAKVRASGPEGLLVLRRHRRPGLHRRPVARVGREPRSPPIRRSTRPPRQVVAAERRSSGTPRQRCPGVTARSIRDSSPSA